MSLKAINESYCALLARALRSTVVAHIKKYMRQMMAMLLAGLVSNCGNATIGGSGFWWQCYYRDGRQIMAMQRKELMIYLSSIFSGIRDREAIISSMKDEI